MPKGSTNKSKTASSAWYDKLAPEESTRGFVSSMWSGGRLTHKAVHGYPPPASPPNPGGFQHVGKKKGK